MPVEIFRETRRGPLGIMRKRVPVGSLGNGEAGEFVLDDRHGVAVQCAEYGSLELTSTGESVRVEFRAEPQRRRPKLVFELNHTDPATRTDRRHIVVQSVAEGNERLIFQREKFVPFVLKSISEAIEFGIRLGLDEVNSEIQQLKKQQSL